MVIFGNLFEGRFSLDNLNKMKNVCSKSIGMKIKNKEAPGEDDQLPPDLPAIESLTADDLSVRLSSDELY